MYFDPERELLDGAPQNQMMHETGIRNLSFQKTPDLA
jgi:hypothetical protein